MRMIDKKIINTGRQFEVDVAKAFAVFFMIVVHVFEHTVTYDESPLWYLVEFFGCAPSAGVFMFVMGLGMVYTRHDSPADFVRRGIKLLIAGYLLNFFRQTLLLAVVNAFFKESGYDGGSLLGTFMFVDILQFAGTAFLFMALFKKLELRPWMILVISIVMSLLGSLTPGLFDNAPEYIQYPVGLLIYTNSETVFPAMQWLIYPALGICFGHLLQHVKDKDRFYRIALVIALIAALAINTVFLLIGIDASDFFMESVLYYTQAPLTLIWCLSVVALLIPLYYFVGKVIRGKAAVFVKYISANLTTIYVIQWLLLGNLRTVLKMNDIEFPGVTGLALSLLIAIVSISLCLLWKKVNQEMVINLMEKR